MDLSDCNEDQLAQRWHQAHNYIAAMEKALSEHPKYVNAKETIEAIKQIATQRLQDSGANAINTPHGTIHTVSKTTARILDPELLWNFAHSTNHPRDFFDLKANMTSCRDHMRTYNEPVPGVELSTFRRLSITAPKAPMKTLKEDPNVD